MQLFLFLFPLQRIKGPALQNKQVVDLRSAFRSRKVLGTFEKRASAVPPFVDGWETCGEHHSSGIFAARINDDIIK